MKRERMGRVSEGRSVQVGMWGLLQQGRTLNSLEGVLCSLQNYGEFLSMYARACECLTDRYEEAIHKMDKPKQSDLQHMF